MTWQWVSMIIGPRVFAPNFPRHGRACPGHPDSCCAIVPRESGSPGLGAVRRPGDDVDSYFLIGTVAANLPPRTHILPRGSCHSFSVACRWPMARATVLKLYSENRSAMSV